MDKIVNSVKTYEYFMYVEIQQLVGGEIVVKSTSPDERTANRLSKKYNLTHWPFFDSSESVWRLRSNPDQSTTTAIFKNTFEVSGMLVYVLSPIIYQSLETTAQELSSAMMTVAAP
jgi:hypothetical protein